MRRLVTWMLLADVVIVALALVTWLAMRDGDAERGNAVNDGLRGSRPPAGRELPDLRSIPGLEPRAPRTQDLRGDAAMIIATCLDCRSGDIIGGLLGRMRRDDLPEGARVVLVGWDGDAATWTARWRVGGDEDALPVRLLVTTDEAGTRTARRTFGVGPVRDAEESGITYLYDVRGRQRSTYFLGQLVREDLAHDLEILDRG